MIACHPRPSRAACRPTTALASGLVGLSALLLLGPGPARGQSARGVAWREDFARARAESQARGLPLWIQFTGPWCLNCRKMERETLAHPAVVAEAAGRFVPVKLRSDAHEQLALGFGLSSLPATVILDPSGALIGRQEGYADPESFRAFLAGFAPRRGPSPSDDPGPPPPAPALAMGGFCPVTLVTAQRLAPGRPELAVRRGGREFRFARAEDREAFLREPERYLPANGGRCPVRQVDRAEAAEGDPHFGVLYQDRLYLCADAEGRARFLKAPRAYAEADVADQGFCPHCRGAAGALVRGSPRYSVTHDGRRYLFPDPTHLEAFRADPGLYLR